MKVGVSDAMYEMSSRGWVKSFLCGLVVMIIVWSTAPLLLWSDQHSSDQITTTVITFSVPEGDSFKVGVYNAQNDLVKTLENGKEASGDHIVAWDGRDTNGRLVTPGVYFVKLEVSGSIKILKKIVFV
jgi:hypothetical protein